jgi:hypothetical protein
LLSDRHAPKGARDAARIASAFGLAMTNQGVIASECNERGNLMLFNGEITTAPMAPRDDTFV